MFDGAVPYGRRSMVSLSPAKVAKHALRYVAGEPARSSGSPVWRIRWKLAAAASGQGGMLRGRLR
jgi:hypothetical protein